MSGHVRSAASRKSITDLTRRPARAFFTILTLALAVASVGIFAVSPLMDRAMKAEAATDRVPDVTLTMAPLRLSDTELARIARLPNVAAVEPRSLFATRVYIGDRRDRALVIGVPDFARQRADIVSLESGRRPAVGAVLTDRNNESHTSFGVQDGGVARIQGADGTARRLPVTGTAGTLSGADRVVGGSVVFYASVPTVERLSGASGFTQLGLRLKDNRRPAAQSVVAAVRDELRATTAFTAFDDLPVIQEPGGYPGKSEFDKLSSLFTVISLLALLTAVVLVANTMSTLIGEQTGEIAAMKAIGARRRDIRRMYLRTTLLLGALGSVVGVVLGVVLANVLVRYFATLGFGVQAGTGVAVPIVLVSLLVGLAGPPLAALPAIRRASRLPLQQALAASGTVSSGQGRLDALLRRARFLPNTAQIGLRGLGRRKRRSLATVLQISVAVATLLALLSIGAGVAKTTGGWFDDNYFDLWAQSIASQPLDPDSLQAVRSTEGVAQVQPWTQNQIRVAGKDAPAWGLPAAPLMNTHITDGRWYTAAEVRDRASVAVLGRTIAKTTGSEVGDLLTVRSSGGPMQLRVIGISGNQAENGGVLFLPVSTLQAGLGTPSVFNSYWITTRSRDHGAIDRTTARVEDTLAGRGSQVDTMVVYDTREKQIAANRTLTSAITVLGLLIVAISVIGLANAISMAILERTREIGVLRSIGARARDVRRIFATEGLALAAGGWLLGVPLGYLLARGFSWLLDRSVGLEIASVFPAVYVAIALVGTLLLAWLVMLGPLRRAVGFRPGEALRYA